MTKVTRRAFIPKCAACAMGLGGLILTSKSLFADRKRASNPPLSPAAQLKKDLLANNLRIIDGVMATKKKIVRNRWENAPLEMGMLETAELLEAGNKGSGRSIVEAVSSVVLNTDWDDLGVDCSAFHGDCTAVSQVAVKLSQMFPEDLRREEWLKATDNSLAFARHMLREAPSNGGSPLLIDEWQKGGFGGRFWVDEFFTMLPWISMLDQDLAWEMIESFFYDHRPFSDDPRERAVPTSRVRHGLLLWDESNKLMQHDPSTIGTDSFWGRGVGWGLYGLKSFLKYIEAPSYEGKMYDKGQVVTRSEVQEMFAAMAFSLKDRRNDEGGWGTNLSPAHMEECPTTETSATGLITHSLAWGINAGILPGDIFVPVVLRASTLLQKMISKKGDVFGIQPSGGSPSCATVSSSNSEGNFNFGVGALLLANCEVIKLPFKDRDAELIDRPSFASALAVPYNSRRRTILPPTSSSPEPRRRSSNPPRTLIQNNLVITNRWLEQYAEADFSSVDRYMLEHAPSGSNPNFAVMRAVRGTAFIQKYENEGRNPQFMNAALENYEVLADLYRSTWGKRWLSPGVVAYLSLQVYRLTKESGVEFWKNRISNLWSKILQILQDEADYWLATPLPLDPWISFNTGDTKAEENAWLASLFSAAEVFIPEAINNSKWAARARMMAYNSITRPSDPPYISPSDSPFQEVIKTITVSDDYVLINHGEESPFYANATLLLLQLGALPYRVAGREVPPEFYHNVDGLAQKAKSYIAMEDGKYLVDEKGEYYWNRTNVVDPAKPMNFPWAMGKETSLEEVFVAQQADSDFIWQRPVHVAGSIMTNGTVAWQAVQDAKGLWYFQIGSYEWHVPTFP